MSVWNNRWCESLLFIFLSSSSSVFFIVLVLFLDIFSCVFLARTKYARADCAWITFKYLSIMVIIAIACRSSLSPSLSLSLSCSTHCASYVYAAGIVHVQKFRLGLDHFYVCTQKTQTTRSLERKKMRYVYVLVTFHSYFIYLFSLVLLLLFIFIFNMFFLHFGFVHLCCSTVVAIAKQIESSTVYKLSARSLARSLALRSNVEIIRKKKKTESFILAAISFT